MVTATNAAKVEEVVMANREITVQEISEGLDIRHGSVLTIIHDHLNRRRCRHDGCQRSQPTTRKHAGSTDPKNAFGDIRRTGKNSWTQS